MIRANNSTILRSYIRNAILIFLLLSTSLSVISGQRSKQQAPPLRERLFFGGSLGLQIGTVTNIEVSPVIGLWVLPRVAIAAGPEYMYYQDPYFSTSIWGGKAYSELVLLQDLNTIIPVGMHMGIFLHAEFESLSLESEVWNTAYASDRFMLNTALAGGGISQRLGQRSSLNFIVLWVISGSDYGFYNNPEIRLSFSF
jgi:hypothetical protein